MQINQYQEITLRAFLEALAQQTAPLPENLKQQISQTGKIFTTDIKAAIDKLADLAQAPQLQPIYTTTRQAIQPDYQPEELNEHAKVSHNPDQELIMPRGVVNNVLAALESAEPAQASQLSKELKELAALQLSKKTQNNI